MYVAALPRRPLGASIAAQATCPPCSYLWEGSCLVCEAEDAHPGCLDCVNGKPKAPPWYLSDMFLAITSSVVVAVVSTIAVSRIERRLHLKK